MFPHSLDYLTSQVVMMMTFCLHLREGSVREPLVCRVETLNACLWIIFSPIAETLASGRVAAKSKRQTLHKFRRDVLTVVFFL